MRPKRAIFRAIAMVGLVVVASCTDDGQGGSAVPATHAGARYLCSSPTDFGPTEIPIRLVAAGVCGYGDRVGHVTYGVVVQNVGDQPLKDVVLEVDVKDRSGQDVADPQSYRLMVIEPGQELGVGYDVLLQRSAEEATLHVQASQPPVVDEPEARADIVVSNVTSTVEGRTRRTSFELTSSYPFAVHGIAAYVVYRDAAGIIVGGDADQVAMVEANGTATHTVSSTYQNPEIAQVDVYVNENPAYPWPGAE
jgi:hypothetical protein